MPAGAGGMESVMKIAVVGSINMDMVVTADRVPMKGETLRGHDIRYVPGGKGANQAVAMARLGAEVEMFGCVGKDGNGKALLENLRKEHVGVDYIRELDDVATGVAMITVAENDNCIVVVAGANGEVSKEYVDSIKDGLLKADMVVLQHEIPLETVEYTALLAAEHGIRVVLNPAPASPVSPEEVEAVSFVTPNEHEAKILFGDADREELLRRYPEKLVITLGSEGVTTALKDGTILTVPCRPSKVVDTTGAGDTLNGAFAVKIAEGAGIEEALRFANTAAGLSVEKFGAQGGMPTREEVERELNKN